MLQLLERSEEGETAPTSSSISTTKYIPDDTSTRERPGFGIRELRLQRKMQVASTRDPCRDTRDWTKAKRARADMKETVVKNDSLPLDIVVNKKSAAVAIWQSALGLAEVTQMRGNFWRTTGTTHPITALRASSTKYRYPANWSLENVL